MNIEGVVDFIFSLNLLLLALDHFVSGGMAIVSPKRAIEMYKKMFGFSMPEKEHYIAILKPWGALGVFAAVVGILPIFDPVRYIGVLFALVLLLGIRINTRLRSASIASVEFGLNPKRNRLHIWLILICAVTIVTQIVWISLF